MRSRSRQLSIEFRQRGGQRRGGGRKPTGQRRGVPHLRRPALATRHPVHVTLKIRPGLGNLREKATCARVFAALREGCDRMGFRIVHFSVQRDHIHLICEAKDAEALARGVQGLSIRLARALNRRWGRSGKVFADRYHADVLKTPRRVRFCIQYVLNNFRKHRAMHGDPPPDLVDVCSSAPWFDGFRTGRPTFEHLPAPPIAAPHTWLLTVGWRRHGLIPTDAYS